MNKYYAMVVNKLSDNEISNSYLHVFNSKKERDKFIANYTIYAYVYCYKICIISSKEVRRFLNYRLTGKLTSSFQIDDLIDQGVEKGICDVH